MLNEAYIEISIVSVFINLRNPLALLSRRRSKRIKLSIMLIKREIITTIDYVNRPCFLSRYSRNWSHVRDEICVDKKFDAVI